MKLTFRKIQFKILQTIIKCTRSNMRKIISIESIKSNCENIYTNECLNFLYNKKFLLSPVFDFSEEQLELTVPENFSLLDNPNVVMEFNKKVNNIRYSNRKKVVINFLKCQNLDIGALTILNVILLHLKDETKRNGKNIEFRTTFTGKIDLDILIYRVGIITLLKLESFPIRVKNYIEEIKNKIEERKIKTLPLLAGGKNKINFLVELILLKRTAKYFPDNVKFGSEVVNFINQCLETAGVKLNLRGNRNFKNMIGEIATNSFEHLGEEMSQLYCTGYYMLESIERGQGSIIFFNFGNTIYEGLKNDSTIDIRSKLQKLSSIHKFDYTFTEENLWTVAALQPKISRKYNQNIGNERGTGTIRLIEGFKKFSNDENKKMTIISGKTQIIFDNSKLTSYNEEDKRIAFNKENKLEIRPNLNYVKNLNHSFPGTIIIIQFSLDGTYLKSVADE